jgi:hypothetical protein
MSKVLIIVADRGAQITNRTLKMLISLPELVYTRCLRELETNLYKQIKLQAKSFDSYAFVMSKSNDIASSVQCKIFYLCHSDFQVHEVVDGLWSNTFMTTDEICSSSQRNLGFFGTWQEKCTIVTNDGSRDLNGSKYVVA